MWTSWLPDDLKRQLLDAVVAFLDHQLERFLDEKLRVKLRSLSSQMAMRQALDAALERTMTRFQQEYVEIDEDLTSALIDDLDFWQNAEVRKALLTIVSAPGIARPEAHAQLIAHFKSVLPQRRNRERVDKAVTYLLQLAAEEIWTIPGAREVRELYALQMQRLSVTAMRQQIALLQEQLQATVQLSADLERSEGQFQRRLGMLTWIRGRYDQALTDSLDKAEQIARKYDDEAELVRVWDIRSIVLANQGQLQKAQQLAQMGVEISERLNDLELKVLAAHRLCQLEAMSQRFDEALAWLDQCEQLARQLGWSRALARMAYRRGAILIRQGNIAAAEPFLLQTMEMAASWGERRLIGYSQHRLAQVYAAQNQLDRAYQSAKDARDLFERLGMVVKQEEVVQLLQQLEGGDHLLRRLLEDKPASTR